MGEGGRRLGLGDASRNLTWYGFRHSIIYYMDRQCNSNEWTMQCYGEVALGAERVHTDEKGNDIMDSKLWYYGHFFILLLISLFSCSSFSSSFFYTSSFFLLLRRVKFCIIVIFVVVIVVICSIIITNHCNHHISHCNHHLTIF